MRFTNVMVDFAPFNWHVSLIFQLLHRFLRHKHRRLLPLPLLADLATLLSMTILPQMTMKFPSKKVSTC